jgi:hypothetical protein
MRNMSEGITHIAVVDDALRLAARDAEIHPAFPAAAAAHHDLARLGGITRHGDRHNPGLLERLRAAWPAAGPAGAAGDDGARLAFVLGWLSHRAADRTFKIVFRTLDGDCPHSPTDCSVYHDVCILREVYAADHGDFALALRLAAHRRPGDAVGAAEDALRALLALNLLALHTFIPDDEHAETWLDRLIARRQRFTVDLGRYAQALAAPDPDRVRRFLVEPRFHDPAEPLLRCCRQEDQGLLDPAVLETALAAAATGCLYAQAVRRAYRYLRAASAFFAGRIGREELARRLDLGRPERIAPEELA